MQPQISVIELVVADLSRSFDPGWEPPAGGHRIALAFACDDPADVDRVHAEMVAAG